MKRMFTILCAASFVTNAWAQTLSPGTATTTPGVFTYDFKDILTGTTAEKIFTISGLKGNSTYTITVEQDQDIISNQCGEFLAEPNFEITTPLPGTITNGTGTFYLAFHPTTIVYDVPGSDWNGNLTCYEEALDENQGDKTAIIKIYVGVSEVPTFTINASGSSSTLVTSVGQKSQNEKVTLAYPNPTKGLVYVKESSEIYDRLGNKVAQGLGTLDISALPSGIYLLKSSKGQQKMIKE